VFSLFSAPHCALYVFGCGFLFGLLVFFSFVVPLSGVVPLFIYLFRTLELLPWLGSKSVKFFLSFPFIFPFFLSPYYLTPPTYHPSPFLFTYTPKSYHPIFLLCCHHYQISLSPYFFFHSPFPFFFFFFFIFSVVCIQNKTYMIGFFNKKIF